MAARASSSSRCVIEDRMMGGACAERRHADSQVRHTSLGRPACTPSSWVWWRRRRDSPGHEQAAEANTWAAPRMHPVKLGLSTPTRHSLLQASCRGCVAVLLCGSGPATLPHTRHALRYDSRWCEGLQCHFLCTPMDGSSNTFSRETVTVRLVDSSRGERCMQARALCHGQMTASRWSHVMGLLVS